MHIESTSWRWAIWIACFAVLLNALSPSISHTLAARHGGPATWEICRADGDARVAPAPAPELVLAGAAAASAKKFIHDKIAAMDDCGYCLPHGGSVALMPSTVTSLGLLGVRALRPFLFYRAPQPLLALAGVPPRGPPAA